MQCFRKQKNSESAVVYFTDSTQVNEGVDSQEDTHTHSSVKEPTPSSKVVERPLQKPTIVVSGCEGKESKGVQTRQSTDQTKQCQFCEESEGLPPSLITAIQSSHCTLHNGKPLDLYCPSHKWAVCPVCAATSHLGCPLIQNLDDVLQEKDEQLQKFVHALKDHEKNVAELKRKVKAKLKSMDSWPGEVSDDKVESSTRKTDWQGGDHREARKCPDHSPQPEATHGSCEMCRLLASHSKDCAFMQHLVAMEARRNESPVQVITLPQEALSTSQEVSRGSSPCLWITLTASHGSSYNKVQLSPQSSPTQSPQARVVLTTMTDQSHGPIQSSPGSSPTDVPAQKRRRTSQPQDEGGPSGPALAKVLEVGHRVKRSRDTEGRNLGTVIAVPSSRTSTPNGDTTGLVDVRWDSGGEGSYCMGRHNHYELDLA